MKRFFVLLATFGFATSAFAENTITLGASVQESGRLANTGRYYRDGYQFAIDQINTKGGVTVRGKHYKLALKLLDNQSDVSLSARQYLQLISQDKVTFLLGPFGSDFALADSSIAEEYQTPMIEGGGASSQIFSRGYEYVFGMLPAASRYFSGTIDAMTELKPANASGVALCERPPRRRYRPRRARPVERGRIQDHQR